MSVLYIALPVALALAAVFAWAFVRTVQQGAYDDLETPALRAIADDEPVGEAQRPLPARTGAEASADGRTASEEPPATKDA